MLLCLVAIPSLVRAAVIPVTFTTASNRTGCNFLNVVFNATPSGCVGTPSYQWYYIHNPVTSSADTVIVSSGPSATTSRAFSALGSYNVGVRVVCGSDTGYSFQNNYINVTTPPTIDFAVTNPADAAPRCVGNVSFTNLSTGDTVCSNHVWTWIVSGPATFANQNTTNANFNFTVPGDYTITLLFNGAACGCGGNVTKTSYIHIVGDPTACIARTDANLGCSAPVATTFSAGCSTGATSYRWSATGGSVASYNSTSPTDTTFSTTFTAPGDYPVNVTVFNGAGCSSVSSTIMVHVGNFTANFLPSPDTVCELQNVTFTDNTTVDVIAPVTHTFYCYDIHSPGAPILVDNSSSTTWVKNMNNGSGLFRIDDYLVNGNGCTSTASHFIYVRPRPATTITADNPYRCTTPLTTGYHALPVVNSNTYRWITPSATVTLFSATGAAGGANHTYTYNTAGSYNVTLVVTDIHGCVDSTVNSGIARVAPANVTISTDIDSGCTPIHVGYHMTIDVAGATINVDSVNFGDGSTVLGAGIYTDTGHIYSNGGSWLTKVNWHLDASLGGCSGSDTVRVLIGAAHPTIRIGTFPLTATGLHLPYSDSVCPNTNVFFKDTGCAACSHFWVVPTGPSTPMFYADTFSVPYPRPSSTLTGSTDFTYTEVSCLAGCCDTFRHQMWVFPPSIFPNSLTAANAYIAAGLPNCTRRDTLKFTATGVTGAYRYHWYFGPTAADTASTTLPTVAHNFSLLPTATASYTVVVTAIAYGPADSSNCFNSASLVVKFGPPDSTWTIVDSNLCAGSMVTVHGPHRADTTAYPQYFWTWGDGPGVTSIASDSNATHTYTTPGNYPIKVITTNDYGCKDTAKVKRVHVFGGFGSVTAAPNPVCAGDLVTFTDGHTFPNSALFKRMVSYAYSPSATTLTSIPITPNTFTHAFPEGTFTVAISDTDNSPKRCPTFDTLVINSVVPHAYFTSPDTLGACAGVAVAFHDTNTHCKYVWNFGDGTPSTVASAADSNVVHTYTANGNYSVTVTIISDGTGGYPFGCSSSFTRNNYIHLSSISGIGIDNFGDTSVGCPPLQLAMGPTSTSNSYLYTYTWSVSGTPTTTYNGAYYFDQVFGTGSHTVTMIATSPRGCKDTLSRNIFVGGPTGFITVTPTSGCAPVSVNLHFTNTGSAALGTNYIWSVCPFGSFTSTTPDTTLVFATAGDYCTPSVIIENTGCIVNVNSTDSIHIYPTPIVTVTHAPRICYGATDVLTATGADTYSWASPTGIICSSCSFIAVSPLVTTVYTVTGTNVSGCTDVELVTVNVDSPIIIHITGRDSMCIGEQDTLFATGGSGVFSWTTHPGPDTTSGLSCNVCNPVIVRTTTTKTYWAITTNALGCKDSASFKVTVNPLPIMHVSPDPAYVCAGDSTQLIATGANKYLWKPRIGLSNDSIGNPKSGILANIIYTVTGTTQYGCRDSITVPVESYHRNFTEIRSDTVICAGDKARLFATGGLSYVWHPGNHLTDSTIYNPIATPPVTTLYTVHIHENPCFDTTRNVLVTVIPLPILRVPPTTTIIAGNSVQLYADTLNHVFLTSYAWTPADSTLTCTDCPHPIATPIVTTTYSVTATTIEGCAGSATVTVKLLCETSQVFIPNTFTPNGDGNNDRFYVSGKGLGLIKRMAVYNRWGELVYEAYNVRPNDPGVGWDGTYRGEVVAPDVFVYVLDVMCSTGEPFVFRGDISLVR